MYQNQTIRPEKVGSAIKLLYITLGIGLLRSILEVSTHGNIASPAFVMLIEFFTLGIMWLFIYMIGKGRNWARIIFLLLFIIGLPSFVLLLQSLAANPISGLLGIGQTVIQIIALIFLFQGPSSDWFRRTRGKLHTNASTDAILQVTGFDLPMNKSTSEYAKRFETRTPNQCFKCGKRLQLGGGTFFGSGSDLVSHMSNFPYNCKACGTAFCIDCMSIMKKGNRRCSYCNNDIGW